MERLFIECTDGTQQWREYLPFYLGDDKKLNTLFMKAGNLIASSRQQFYNGIFKMLLSEGATAAIDHVIDKTKGDKIV